MEPGQLLNCHICVHGLLFTLANFLTTVYTPTTATMPLGN